MLVLEGSVVLEGAEPLPLLNEALRFNECRGGVQLGKKNRVGPSLSSGVARSALSLFLVFISAFRVFFSPVKVCRHWLTTHSPSVAKKDAPKEEDPLMMFDRFYELRDNFVGFGIHRHRRSAK